MNSEYSVIITYVIFMGVVTTFISWGAPDLIQGYNSTMGTPSTPAADPLSQLIWVVQNVGFMFQLIAVTAFTYPVFGIVLLGYTTAFIYMLIRLIRGGG